MWWWLHNTCYSQDRDLHKIPVLCNNSNATAEYFEYLMQKIRFWKKKIPKSYCYRKVINNKKFNIASFMGNRYSYHFLNNDLCTSYGIFFPSKRGYIWYRIIQNYYTYKNLYTRSKSKFVLPYIFQKRKCKLGIKMSF